MKDLPTDPDSLLSVRDFLEYLDCSETIFNEMMDAGRLPPVSKYVGKKPRWRSEDVRKWVRKPDEPDEKPQKTPKGLEKV